MITSELDLALTPAANDAAQALTDRRRPGRPDTVNPKLLHLLRAEERAKLAALAEPPYGSTDHPALPPLPNDRYLGTGEAVTLAAAIGALIWAALIAAGWAALTA